MVLLLYFHSNQQNIIAYGTIRYMTQPMQPVYSINDGYTGLLQTHGQQNSILKIVKPWHYDYV